MIEIGKYIRNIDEINQIFRNHRLLKIFSIVFYTDHNFYVDYITKINEIFKIDAVSEILKNINRASSKDVISSDDYNRVNEALKILVPVVCEDIETYLEEYLYEYPELIEKFQKVKNDVINLINSIEIAKPRKAIYSTEWNKRALAVVLPHSFIVSLFLKYEVESFITAIVDSYLEYIESNQNIIDIICGYFLDSVDNEILVDISYDSFTYYVDLNQTIDYSVFYSTVSIDSLCDILIELYYTLYLIDLYSYVYLILDYTIESIDYDSIIESILDSYIESVSSINSIILSLYQTVYSATATGSIELVNSYTIEIISSTLSISLSFMMFLSILSKQLPNIQSEFMTTIRFQANELSIISTNSSTIDSITRVNEILLECDAVLAIGVNMIIESIFDWTTNTTDFVSSLTSDNDYYIDIIDSEYNVFDTSILTYYDIIESISYIEFDFETYSNTNDISIFVSYLDIELFNYSYDIIHEITIESYLEIYSFDITKNIETIFDIQTISLSLITSINYTLLTSKEILSNILSITYNVDRNIDSISNISNIDLSKEIVLSWYSIRYRYKANLTITNIYNQKLENIVVALIFKNEISNLMANGDVAFVNPSTYQRYNHYRERDDYRNITIIFVRIPEINANSSITIEMYYGSIDDDTSNYDTFDSVVLPKDMTLHIDERLISTRLYKLS